MAKFIRITWIKSGIGHPAEQRRTVAALGLHHINQSVQHEDSPSIRGMVNKVSHLVKVEEGVKPSETK